MGAKQSSNGRMRTYSNAGDSQSPLGSASAAGQDYLTPGPSSSSNPRGRARSLGSVHSPHPPYNIPSSNGASLAVAGSPDSDASSPDEQMSLSQRFLHASSLPQVPVHLLSLQGIKCPVCTKSVPPDDIECHLVLCLTKPRISYNEDVLTEAKGECVICFEDLEKGEVIARLPCLCIYHKSCIDNWFQVNRSCPEHPSD